MTAAPPSAAFETRLSVGPEPVRLVVVEPNELYRRALIHLFEDDARFDLLAATGRPYEAPTLAEDNTIVLLALREIDDCGIIEQIRSRPNAIVVVLAADMEPPTVCAALRAGARGFIPDHVEPQQIAETILRVAAGEMLVDQSAVTQALIWSIAKRRRERRLDALTRRERETLELLAEGLRPAAIAARFFLSPRTVESHLASVYRKLGVGGRIEALQTYRRIMTGVD
jgi:DNA-binding NarL/FixJ family response regulator